MISHEVTDVLRGWAKGLAAVRRNSVPVETPWGLRIDEVRPKTRARCLVFRDDLDAVRGAANDATAPHGVVIVAAAEDAAAAVLGPAWHSTPPEPIMTTTLRLAPSSVPAGYDLSTTIDAGVIHVRVHSDGEVVAAGYTAVVDGVAVVDRVGTDTAHQRRGLGTAVMNALTVAAMDQGAASAVLHGTEEGRALYEGLGWRLHSNITSFTHAV
ncbi:GNAT family N-acetyltransferase [Catellatospora sp. KI3]|uniref:GNAT family N-acetyltransferase n=1 Tax=Catellatospora sp. KI3 TaxID=3041620 RepID=UPI0024824CBE|nr:GNAT family N-acetyltransferase [Catellatospora sp. KI3]MDI1460785.1 GNAT family N-acetyltransferase [Catellatospora sp. KI3]